MKKGMLVGFVGLGLMLSGCCSGLAEKGGPSEFERLHGIYVEKMIPQIVPLKESTATVDELRSVANKISVKTAAEVFFDHADVCRTEAEKYIADLPRLPEGALDGYEEGAREDDLLDLIRQGYSLGEEEDASFVFLGSCFHIPQMIMAVSRSVTLASKISAEEDIQKYFVLESYGGSRLFLV
ncbi:MAG: hypothetical protein JXR23_04760, partial [Pontiellaceae bacterium]|nr:hypothetical protein [Pontiellaceae bacterium]